MKTAPLSVTETLLSKIATEAVKALKTLDLETFKAAQEAQNLPPSLDLNSPHLEAQVTGALEARLSPQEIVEAWARLQPIPTEYRPDVALDILVEAATNDPKVS